MRITDPELHARRRAEILAAAESCFAKSGFHAASMQDIAGTAGVSMGSLYRYFANKEAIIGSFAELDRAAVIAAIDAWALSAQPVDDFATLIRPLLRAAAQPDQGALVAEIYAEALRNDSLRAALAEHETAVTGALVKAIRQHQRAHRLSDAIDAATVADLFFSLIDGLATRRLLLPRRRSGAQDSDVIDVLCRLLKIP